MKWIKIKLFIAVMTSCFIWQGSLSAETNANNKKLNEATATSVVSKKVNDEPPHIPLNEKGSKTEVSNSMDEMPKVNDPLEPYNRQVFLFNYHFDRAILKPIAELYNKIMPKPLNQGIHNFFLNLNELPIIANDILQLRLRRAVSDTARFGINSTIGIVGLFDVAGRMGLQWQPNDFGLTLARYGYRNSAYLVVPFFGIMTIRDGIGMPVDYYAFSVYPRIRNAKISNGLYVLSIIDKRAQLLNYQSVMEEAAVDQYVFARNAYLQRRQYLLNQTE